MKDIEQRARELEAKVWAAGTTDGRRKVLEDAIRAGAIGTSSTADAQPAGRELALLRAARDLFMSNRITPEQIEAVRVAVNAYAEPLRTSDAPHVTISAAEYDEVRLTLARQATELHDLRGRNDAQRYTRDEVIAWSKEGAEDVPEDGRLAGRPDAPREESRLDELLTEVADLVRYWKAYGDDDPGVLSRVADVARAFKDLPPSSRDKAKTSGNEQSPLAPVSGGAEDPSRIMSGSNAGRDGVAAGETAPDNPLAGVRVRRRPETASGSALGDHDRAVALIVEHKIPWCRARLMHVLAACEEQGTVLEEVLEELLPEENGGRGDHDNYENGEQIAGAIEAALRRTGWLGGESASGSAPTMMKPSDDPKTTAQITAVLALDKMRRELAEQQPAEPNASPSRLERIETAVRVLLEEEWGGAPSAVAPHVFDNESQREAWLALEAAMASDDAGHTGGAK